MPPTTIREAPALEAFTLLADHQSQTPTSFFGAKPVLHYHGVGARALAPRDQISKLPIFSQTTDHPAESVTGEGAQGAVEVVVDAFINSENLTLFNNTTSTGLSIPYPSISLHAIQRLPDPADVSRETQGLYMQLELSDPYSVSEEDEPEIVELTLITSGADIQTLFEAVSNCSNLHPDPMQQDEEMEDGGGDSRIIFEGNVGYEGISGLPGVQRGSDNGGLPPPFPGSGGWITAENVSEYFDEEGNFIGGGTVEVLGEGAGRVRAHDEVDEDGTNGHSEDHVDDNKRPRTDG